ncbi:unnamed protein product [Coregonus sp. 'balchen']|nr:unnamed protein product [Coregonus sp. 'balchen']
MPISSGAEGRVDVGIDTSIAWTPDGVKKEAKLVKNCDSYLRRMPVNILLVQMEKTWTLSHPVRVSIDPNTQQKKGTSDEGKTSGKQTNEKSSKKSQTCTLL